MCIRDRYSGEYRIRNFIQENFDVDGDSGPSSHYFDQRFRNQFTVKISDYLWASMRFDAREELWGTLDEVDQPSIDFDCAYLGFAIPGTQILCLIGRFPVIIGHGIWWNGSVDAAAITFPVPFIKNLRFGTYYWQILEDHESNNFNLFPGGQTYTLYDSSGNRTAYSYVANESIHPGFGSEKANPNYYTSPGYTGKFPFVNGNEYYGEHAGVGAYGRFMGTSDLGLGLDQVLYGPGMASGQGGDDIWEVGGWLTYTGIPGVSISFWGLRIQDNAGWVNAGAFSTNTGDVRTATPTTNGVHRFDLFDIWADGKINSLEFQFEAIVVPQKWEYDDIFYDPDGEIVDDTSGFSWVTFVTADHYFDNGKWYLGFATGAASGNDLTSHVNNLWASAHIGTDNFTDDNDFSPCFILFNKMLGNVKSGYVPTCAEAWEDPDDDIFCGYKKGTVPPNTPGKFAYYAYSLPTFANGWYIQGRAGIKPTDKLRIDAKVTYAEAIEDTLPPSADQDNDYGVELDLSFQYKIYDNLQLYFGFGYLWTGGFFDGPKEGNGYRIDPSFEADDAYEFETRLTFIF